MHEVMSPEAALVGLLPDSFRRGEMDSGIRLTTAANGTDFWLVSDYKIAREVLGSPSFEVLGSPRARRAEDLRPKSQKLLPNVPAANAIISLEGADHIRVRGLVAHAFTERRIAELKPFVTDLTEDLLDDLEAQPTPVDFVSHISAVLPYQVLCHILGVPVEDRKIFGSWVNVLFRLSDDDADSRQHSVSLARYMMQLVARKRLEPKADLISDLIRSAGQNKSVTDRELVTLCLSLLMAGYDSTADQITLCILMLMLDRPLMKRLASNPDLITPAVEELLRINPAPYMTFARMSMEPVSIGGVTLQPGQLVVVFIMGANRDGSVFGQADQVSLDQPARAHLTFGHGMHRCLGAPLARLQLEVLLSAVLRRFPKLSLSGDVSALEWKTGMATRGPGHMYVSWK